MAARHSAETTANSETDKPRREALSHLPRCLPTVSALCAGSCDKAAGFSAQ